ncbi:hypothetical protein Tco_0588802 [Tanacetum coccineum]
MGVDNDSSLSACSVPDSRWKKFDFSSTRTCSTPIETNKALTKDEDAFSDSDYAGASLDRKSTTGAAYIAASHCCGQVLWIQNQMLDYGYKFMQTKIHVDNESVICVVKNPVYHSKIKHIKIRYHFIRDSYEKRLIEMVKIHTDNNVADLLTKAFDFLIFLHGLCIDMDPHEFLHVYLDISSVLVMNRGMLLHTPEVKDSSNDDDDDDDDMLTYEMILIDESESDED